MTTGPLTVLQFAPLSVETSIPLAAAVSVPTVAVPLLRTGVKLIGLVAVLSRLTVNTAAPPSAVGVGPVTLIVGRSSSVPTLSATPVVLVAR